jgi:hypothetical protein
MVAAWHGHTERMSPAVYRRVTEPSDRRRTRLLRDGETDWDTRRHATRSGAYHALVEMTDAASALCWRKATGWAATHPMGDGEEYNIANGDLFRWDQMWPSRSTSTWRLVTSPLVQP